MTINQVNNLESALSVRQKINLTIDKANSIPDNMTATWNNSGEVFTGIKLNITDTASDSESLLMNLFVDGNSKFSVQKDGLVYSAVPTNAAAATSYAIESGANFGFGGYFDSPALVHNGSATLWANDAGAFSTIGYWTGANGRFTWNNDTYIYRDAANTLAQRNSTNAQTFNIYNTYTNGSNYERGFMKWNSNVLEIGTEAVGTGTQRTVRLVNIPINNLWVESEFANYGLQFNNSGELVSVLNGQRRALFGSAIQTWNVGQFCWSSTSDGTAVADTGLARNAAGVVKVTNGSTGIGDLIFGNGSMTPTWDDAGTTFTAIKMNVTNTASSLNSALMDLQIDGASKFRVRPGIGGVGFVISNETASTIRMDNSIGLQLGIFGGNTITVDSIGVRIENTYLKSTTAHILEQRNGTNAQTFNLYNTYTDASNYERGFMKWNANVLEIGAEAAGTGTARNVVLNRVSQVRSSGDPDQYINFAAAGYFSFIDNAGKEAVRYGTNQDCTPYAQFRWAASAASIGGPKDVGIKRAAAGQLQITDGSTGTGELIFIVPTSDPGITGALWNNGGVLSISA